MNNTPQIFSYDMYIMKWFTVSFLFMILLSGINTGSSVESNDNIIIFSQLDQSTGEWYNLTITSSKYIISTKDVSNEIKFLSDPWFSISQEIEAVNFFKTQINEDDPHTVIDIRYNGNSNKQSISHVNIIPERLPMFLAKIYDRVSGLNYNVWPVDFEILILESYPEQYSVSVLFQRANDLLAVVYEKTVSLYVTSSDPLNDTDSLINIYSENKTLTINSGGQSQIIEFSTFTGSEKYRELYFTVVMESGIYLYLAWNTSMPVIGELNNRNIPNNQSIITETFPVWAPNLWYVIISLGIPILIRKKN